jgi:hypothetical protein
VGLVPGPSAVPTSRSIVLSRMRTNRVLGHVADQRAIRFWTWIVVAYLAVVLLLLILGGQIGGVPSPSDIGWSD